jgi:putative ABC transport system permease protein
MTMTVRPAPPKFARRLLRRCVARHRRDEVADDLAELFALRAAADGLWVARWHYWRDVASVCHRRALRAPRPGWPAAPTPASDPRTSFFDPAMLTNYLKVALRNVRRHPGYTAINVAGLGVGMACCLLIALYLRHETSYDRFHAQADRLYRVVNDVQFPTGLTQTSNTSAFVGPVLEEELPEVEHMARLARARSSFLFEHEGVRFEESDLLFADSTVLEVFSFPLLAGDPATALDAPFSLVLTEAAARKYFGDGDAVGQTLVADGQQAYTVTGVLAPVPEASHLQFDGLISMSTAAATQAFYFQDLLDLRFATFLLLRPGADAGALQAKLPALVERLLGAFQRRNNFAYTFHLVPLRDVYFHEPHRGLGAHGNRATLVTFAAIALFTLVIACINFINLATARSVERAREVGMRKVVGAHRHQLALQFVGETVVLSLAALGVALALAALLLPAFNALAETSLRLSTLVAGRGLAVLAGGMLGVGLLAGAYPALVLSGFRPIAVVRGRFQGSARGARLRKGLVVFQFAITVALIAGTLVVDAQIRYMQRQSLGFRSEQMLVVDFRSDAQVQEQVETIKAELERVPGVLAASASQVVPGRLGYTALAHLEAADGQVREFMMPVFPVDYDFLDVFGLELVAGRNFSPDFAGDAKGAFLVNERAVRAFGYRSPEEILGKPLREWGQEGQVIGVVKDFHYASLRSEIAPANFLLGAGMARYVTLRLAADDLPATMAAVETAWKRLVPHRPFTYAFLDEAFDEQYRAEERFGRIVGSFSALAILVACLGLFGLAAFTAAQRTREIGVRKVLGASVSGIVLLLSKDFAKLVVAGFVVAVPVAYVGMGRWLDDFAYRIPLSGGLFAAAGGAALAVAVATVSYQALRAALADPVEALRYE